MRGLFGVPVGQGAAPGQAAIGGWEGSGGRSSVAGKTRAVRAAGPGFVLRNRPRTRQLEKASSLSAGHRGSATGGSRDGAVRREGADHR